MGANGYGIQQDMVDAAAQSTAYGTGPGWLTVIGYIFWVAVGLRVLWFLCECVSAAISGARLASQARDIRDKKVGSVPLVTARRTRLNTKN